MNLLHSSSSPNTAKRTSGIHEDGVTAHKYAISRVRPLVRELLPPIGVFVLICLALEALVRGGVVESFILPPPSDVYRALTEPGTDLYTGLARTTRAALTGFTLSAFLGVGIAILLSMSIWIRRSLYPYAVFFQTVPIIAIAPMLVIWTDTQFQTVTAAACIASIFPVIASTYVGLASTDPALRDMFKLYRAGPITTLLKLRLPFALPSMFTGLRVAAGLSVIGAMVGEFVGGGGLGSVIEGARPLLRNDKVFAAVLLGSLLGLVLFLIVGIASRLTLRHWHASAASEN